MMMMNQKKTWFFPFGRSYFIRMIGFFLFSWNYVNHDTPLVWLHKLFDVCLFFCFTSFFHHHTLNWKNFFFCVTLQFWNVFEKFLLIFIFDESQERKKKRISFLRTFVVVVVNSKIKLWTKGIVCVCVCYDDISDPKCVTSFIRIKIIIENRWLDGSTWKTKPDFKRNIYILSWFRFFWVKIFFPLFFFWYTIYQKEWNTQIETKKLGFFNHNLYNEKQNKKILS